MSERKLKLVFSRTGGFISNIIARFTRSNWSHVDLLLEDAGELLGAIAFKGVVLRPKRYLKGVKHEIRELDVTEKQYQGIISFQKKQLGKKYDWTAVIYGFGFRRNWEDPKRWFCSELQAASIKKAGLVITHEHPYKVSPRDLYIMSSLHKPCNK